MIVNPISLLDILRTMSYDDQTADLDKLNALMHSRGYRQNVTSGANAARGLLWSVKNLRNKLNEQGKVPDDQIDNVNEHMPLHADSQEIISMIPVLTKAAQILEKMKNESVDLPYLKSRTARRGSANTAAQAIPVGGNETEDDDEFDEENVGGASDGVLHPDAIKMMRDAGLDSSQVKEAVAEISSKITEASGGGGNLGPVQKRPKTSASFLSVGSALKKDMDEILSAIPSELKGAPEIVGMAVKVEKTPAEVAQAATDNAAAQGYSTSIDLTED